MVAASRMTREASSESDERARLVRTAQAGDRRALSQLLARLGPAMLGTARRILGPSISPGGSDAEDAVQEAMVDLVRGLGNLERPDRVEAYAVRVAARRAIRTRRRLTPQGVDDAVDERAATLESADAHVARRRRAAALLALLDELPEAQAEALYLRVALGYSLDEVATTMGVPSNTVRSRVRLAREAIRRKLDKRPALRQLLENPA